MNRPSSAIRPDRPAVRRSAAAAILFTAAICPLVVGRPAPPPPVRDAPPTGTGAETAPATVPATAGSSDTPELPDTRQILVRPGQNLADALAGAGPGDEFILWPGTYSGTVADKLVGEPGRPITIRGLRPDDPPVLAGGPWGLRLHGASHVVVEHLIIREPRIDGIEIRPLDGSDVCGPVTLRNLRIEDVGDRSGRHGVLLRHVRDVRIDSVEVHGWTGSAIEIIGCEDVLAERLTLIGRDRGELLGLRLRAGCSHVVVRETHIEAAGRGGIVLGGRSRLRDFPDWGESKRPDDLRWEVADPTLEDIVIRDVDVALTLLGVTRAAIYGVSAIGPRRAFLRIARASEEPGFGVLDSTILGRSLLAASESHPDARIIELAPGVRDDGLWLEENLWWRPGGFDPDTLFPGRHTLPQLVSVDPKLNASSRPEAAAAADFGARFAPVVHAAADPEG